MNLYQKIYSDLHPYKLNVRKMTRWQDEPSEDYPLGGNNIQYEKNHFNSQTNK